MRFVTTPAALRCYLALHRPAADASAAPSAPSGVGLVPTMGALHEGHLSLIRRARARHALVVVSIFANPLQFGPGEDLDRYPRPLERDRDLCRQEGVDLVFAPSPADLGLDRPEAESWVVPPASLRSGLCGRSRPGHFEGVATIVAKLFNLVRPDRAYFGRKDAQQLAIVQQLVRVLDFPVAIEPCPIVREPDGLALSSRNRYLSPAERQQAPALYRALRAAADRFQQGERSRAGLTEAAARLLAEFPAFDLDYIELVHPETMTPLDAIETSGLLAAAARLGNTRLIDNVLLRETGPTGRRPIVAIDGPAGAGKSTVTRRVADRLGLLYLDTGAMYRAVAWAVLKAGVDPADRVGVAEVAARCRISFGEPAAGSVRERRLWLNGEDVTDAIRTAEVTAVVSAVAAHPEVREALVRQQQSLGEKGGLVAEGRDIGTHVFPEAEVKIFLTASVQERSRRRQRDLRDRGQPAPDLERLQREIAERDRQDSTRAIAPLQKAEDARELTTDGMTVEEVVAAIVDLYRERSGLG